jgi:hypothetical protein
MAAVACRRRQHDASAGKRPARSAQDLDAFGDGGERGPLQAVAAGDDRQRQEDAARPMRRKGLVRQAAPERERVDRKSNRLGGECQLAGFARLHADDRDVLGV